MDKSRLQFFLDNPTKALWTLALPIMAGMGIQTLYTIVDMIFIGRLGGNAIAAVAFIMPLFFLILGLTFGLGSGVTASIARFIGARDKINADNSAEHAVFLGLIISAVLTTTGLVYGETILRKLGAMEEILPQSWSYLKVTCFGLPFLIISSSFRSILAGEGDMKTPMLIAGLGTILNIILDPIFIFTLGYGIAGAAIATVLSQIIVFSIFVYMIFVREHTYIRFRLRDFSYSGFIIRDIIQVGLPASISMIIMSFGQLVFNRILIFYSTDAVAAFQVGGRLDMVIHLPIMAIAASLTTMVGMFYGAHEIEKMKFIVKYGLSRSFTITVITSALLYLFAPRIVTVFTNEQSIQSLAVVYLRYILLVYPLISIGMSVGRILQGIGKGLPMLVITSIRILLVSAPLAVFFTMILHKPVYWVWYAMMISTVISVTISIVWLKTAFHKIVLA